MSEWEPATEAEVAMRDALRANDQEQYFRILARTDVLLPIAPDGSSGGEGGWGTWTTEGRTHVLAFTSPSALQECLAGHPGTHRRVPFRDLAGIWPNVEWWLAVNPGLPVEGYLPSWFVTQISRGDVRLPGRTLGARARMEQASSRTRATAQVPLRTVPNQPAPTPIERQRMKADQGLPSVPPSSTVPPRREVPPPDVAPPGAFLPTRADRPIHFERSAGRPFTPPPAAPARPAPPAVPPPPPTPPAVPPAPLDNGPTSPAPTSGAGSIRGRASFPGPGPRGLFDDSDRKSLDVPGERELFTGLDRRSERPQNGAPSSGLPARPSSVLPSSRPVGSDPALPPRPTGRDPGLAPRPLSDPGLPPRPLREPRPFGDGTPPLRPAGGGGSDLPARPSGSGLPQRPMGGEPGLPQRPLGGEPGLPQRPLGGEPGLPQRPLGGEPGLPQRPLGGESGLPQRPPPGDEGRDPRYWPRREPARSIGEVYTEHAAPVIPAAWSPPPDLPVVSGPPLPTRQPQATRPEDMAPTFQPGGTLPPRPGPGRDRPGLGGERPGPGGERPGPGGERSGAPGERGGFGGPSAYRSGEPLPQRPQPGESSALRSGEPLPSRPGAGEPFGAGEPLPSRPLSGEVFRPGDPLPTRPGAGEPYRAGDPLPSRPEVGESFRAGDPLPSRPGAGQPSAYRSGESAPPGEETQPIPPGWAGSAGARASSPSPAPPGDSLFERPGFGRRDVEPPAADESVRPFGDLSTGARSAGFGRDLDEHPFFADDAAPAGPPPRGLFDPAPSQSGRSDRAESGQPGPSGQWTEPFAEPAAPPAWAAASAPPSSASAPPSNSSAPSWDEQRPESAAPAAWSSASAPPSSAPAPSWDQPRSSAPGPAWDEQRSGSWDGPREPESRTEAGTEQPGGFFSGRAEVQSPFFQAQAEPQPSFFGEPAASEPSQAEQRAFFDDEPEPRPFSAFGEAREDDPPIRDPYAALADLRSEPDTDDEPVQLSFASGAQDLVEHPPVEPLRAEPLPKEPIREEPQEPPAPVSWAESAWSASTPSESSWSTSIETGPEKDNTGSFFLVAPARESDERAPEEPSPSLRTFFEDGAAERPDFQQETVHDFRPVNEPAPAYEPASVLEPELPAEPAAVEPEPVIEPEAAPTSGGGASTPGFRPTLEDSLPSTGPGYQAGLEATPESGVAWGYQSDEPLAIEPVYEPEIVEDAPPVRLHDEIVDAEVVTTEQDAPAAGETVPPEAEEPRPKMISAADFRPANTVEKDLFEAVQANSTDRFLSTLLLAKVMIPFWTGDGPIEPARWRTEHMNGLPHLVVFTSQERMTERLGEDARGSWIKFTRMIRHWPPGDQLAFAINPETPAGAVLPGTEVVQLASWATEMGLGVDDPEDEQPVAAAAKPEPVAEKRQAYEPPGSGREQVMQKPISPEQLSYYLERNYDRVSGFVHRAGEVAHLETPEQLYNALGLSYAGSSFKPDAEEAYVLRWIAYRGDLYRIPYGGQSQEAMRAMEGWVIERGPFRGNGFAPSETGDVIAEFKVDSARLPHNAELWRLRRDGRQDLIARLDADGPAWRKGP
ncbi:SseB family protein [Dactylosporangium matsuzakiense]|uniref:SseB protein N-terminal domain-containing protein n=1 Tax=Dactylosporangium matsuzakiense TaxID=53360 RepID=A0A9W6KB85_9ACTN|nr:hypothetical protein GCM10017581_006020 [Dactylosporangium matsuzakiense]